MNPKNNDGWISIKDRLPDNYLSVLLFDSPDREIFVGYMDAGGEFQLEGYSYEYSLGCHFTHWMPLPEPPKEE